MSKNRSTSPMARASALAIGAALAAALGAPAAAGAEYLGYGDLGAGQWYVDSGLVDWAEEHSVVNGYPNGNWGADDPLDRAQAAAILFNWSGDPAPSEPATFDDAAELGWASGACAWAQDEGVFNGSRNPDGTVTMDPWDRITREQVATVLFNMSGDDEGSESSLAAFPDGGEVSAWARGAVSWGVEHRVLGNNGEINPTDPCTRAEFVAMLRNLVDPEVGEGPEPAPDPAPGGGTGGDAGEQPGGGGTTDPEPAPGGEGESGTDPAPGGGTETPGPGEADPYDISGEGFRMVENVYMTEDGEMGGCIYNGHTMYNYFPETGVALFGPDGRRLLSEGDDNPGEDEFRSTAAIDYDSSTITYTAMGVGRYHGTRSITVGFSRFSSVYLASPRCPACNGTLDEWYAGSFPERTQLYAYRCVDSSSETPHECDFCEGRLMSDLLLSDKGSRYDQRLASDEEIQSLDMFCTNTSCALYGKNLKGRAVINTNEMKPTDRYDHGKMIVFH